MSTAGDGGPGGPAGASTAARPRPKVLLFSALPPPSGGIPTWTLGVLGSGLAERYELRVVNHSPGEAHSVSGESRFRLGRAFAAVGNLLRWTVELIRFRPDVAHINTPYYWGFARDGLALWIARLLGVPTLMHPHGGDFEDFLAGASPLFRRFAEATLRRADLCVALAEKNVPIFGDIVGPESVALIPNFVDLADFPAVPDRSQRPASPVKVLYVGWLIEEKGIRELVTAAAAIRDVEFTLIGAEDPAVMESLGDDLARLAHVKRLAPRPRAQVLELFLEADLLVLPSWLEGFPLVVLEAMAAGLPVVATPVGAIPEAIRDGREGRIVPIRDAEALTRALRSLIDDREGRLALGRGAREHVEATFSVEVVAAQLDAAYQRVLAK